MNRVMQWEVDRLNERLLITETVFDQEQYNGEWVPASLDEAIVWLSSTRDEIPDSLRGSARIEVSSESGYEGSHYGKIEITYSRPETDEEWDARKASVYHRLAATRSAEEAEYQRLKAKFG